MGEENIIALACLFLAAAVSFFIFYFREDPADSSPFRTRLDQLLERRDTIYENLRDLRFEYRSGKFSEQDYESTRQLLEAEAAEVLREIDQVTGARLPAAHVAPPSGRARGAASANSGTKGS